MSLRGSRSPVLADLVGGLSLAGLMVPEAIAYSAIAGLPATFGITAAIIGPLGYAIIGRSRLAVVSATSGAAALLAAAIANAGIPNVARADCALALTILVGLFFLAAAILRVAALASFVSRAVLHGFGLGLAVTICVRQLPALLGLPLFQGSIWDVIGSAAAHLSDVHLPSAIVGAVVLIILTLSRRLNFVGAGLILILLAIGAMHFGPAGHFGMRTAGPVSLRFSPLHLPALALKDWGRLAQLALPVALVILAESWATIRSLAAAKGDPIAPGREIAALGLANLASGLLRGLPAGAGFSIGNANAQAGTATRLGAILGALFVALAALGASNWLALIPEPVLAAIVISALSHALSPKPILALFRLDRDQWVAISAAVGVLLFGIVNGLLFAVALSVVGLLRRFTRAGLSELGRAGVHDFVDVCAHPEAERVPGLFIIRPNAPLFFGNCEPILVRIGERARAAGAKAIVLSLEETNDLDSSTLEALADFAESMSVQGRVLVLARVHDRVRSVLERGGLNDLAASATFSVDDAVRSAIGLEKNPGKALRS